MLITKQTTILDLPQGKCLREVRLDEERLEEWMKASQNNVEKFVLMNRKLPDDSCGRNK